MCGVMVASWMDIMKVCVWLVGPANRLRMALGLSVIRVCAAWTDYTVFERIRRVQAPMIASDLGHDCSEIFNFLQILEHSFRRRASHDLDYIYAFPSHPTGQINGHLLIEPSHNLTYFEVYTTVTRRLFESNRMLARAFVRISS
jgi:hypothetical protein